MKAARLTSPEPIEKNPLAVAEIEKPAPRSHEVLLRVTACGICHTDLHVVEGDLHLPKLPLTPGHQIVGIVEAVGEAVTRFKRSDRVGIPWLYATCGECEFCTSDRENLCIDPQFTGYHVDGGFAEFVVVREDFAYSLPDAFADVEAAPLLCAGVIGYRALRLSGIKPGGRIGLYGFGASAHIAIQILIHEGCEAYVYTRSQNHRDLASELGATWTGSAEEKAPHEIDSAVMFAPAGRLVPLALGALKKGGTLALAGIHMSPIPEMKYELLYHERTLRSVANSTRADVRELLDIASRIPVRTDVTTYALDDVNRALRELKESRIRGSGVLVVSS